MFWLQYNLSDGSEEARSSIRVSDDDLLNNVINGVNVPRAQIEVSDNLICQLVAPFIDQNGDVAYQYQVDVTQTPPVITIIVAG